MSDQIQLKIQLDSILKPCDGQWVALCPALDLATQAETEDAAYDSLQEAIEAWFESCLDRGVLVAALMECGFRLLKNRPQPQRS